MKRLLALCIALVLLMSLNSCGTQRVEKDSVVPAAIFQQENILYVLDNGVISAYDLVSGEKNTVLEGVNAGSVIVNGGEIYLTDWETEELLRFDLKSRKLETLYASKGIIQASVMSLYGERLIFEERGAECTYLMCLDLKSGTVSIVSENTNIFARRGLAVASNKIYYSAIGQWKAGYMNLDGSGKTELDYEAVYILSSLKDKAYMTAQVDGGGG